MSTKSNWLLSLLGGAVLVVGVLAYADSTDVSKAASPSTSGWVKPDDQTLRKILTKEQYDVTQHEGTERSFSNAYWDNKKEGIYVDIVSGEPLFSSTDKFKSGTGWPSFTRPLVDTQIVEKSDWAWGMRRTEVRSKDADSHLGHVFNDGPNPTGLRYCVNSASLRFVEKNDLQTEGYEQFLALFTAKKN